MVQLLFCHRFWCRVVAKTFIMHWLRGNPKRDSDKGLCNSTKLLVELGRTEWECHMVSLGMTVQNRVPKREI